MAELETQAQFSDSTFLHTSSRVSNKINFDLKIKTHLKIRNDMQHYWAIR